MSGGRVRGFGGLDALCWSAPAEEWRGAERVLRRSQLCLRGVESVRGGVEPPQLGRALGLGQHVTGAGECPFQPGGRVIVGSLAAGLLGERAPLGDGGDVDPVVAEHLFEDLACVLLVGGEDAEPVLVAPACGADVEAAVDRRCGDEDEADVDGVALVAAGRGGVAELHLRADVVRGEGDGGVCRGGTR